MKYIKLGQDNRAIVDDEDFQFLNQFNWHLANGYAVRHISKKPDKRSYMHREVLATPKDLLTDHINGNKLDNRKSNLRVATVMQNAQNSKKTSRGLSKYKGVSYFKPRNLWRARIRYGGKEWLLGYYKTEMEAALAYRSAAENAFGEYVRYI